MFTTALLSAAPVSVDQSILRSQRPVPDIATFLQIGGSSLAGYTWDGKTVFFQSSMSGAPQVYRLTAEGWPYQLTTFEDGVEWFSLSHGGVMAIVGSATGGNENAQLYLMDTRTGAIVQLTNNGKVQYGQPLWSGDDRYIYYRSNEENGKDFWIYELDVTNGDVRKVFGDAALASGYNSPAELSDDGTLLIVGNYSSNVNNSLYLVNLKTGESRPLTQDTSDVLYANVTLQPDNRTLWLTCNDNAEGISRLARMNTSSSQVEFVNDGWIDDRWDIESLEISRDFKYMGAIYNENGYSKLKVREIPGGKPLKSPPLEGLIGSVKFDINGGITVSFNGPTRAPDVWRWQPATSKLTQLTFASYAGIDRSQFAEPVLVNYESFDGLSIPAFLYLPPGYTKGTRIPFIIHAHGGPESQFQPDFSRNFQYLVLNGYGILAVNPRGSSGYGRSYLALDNYKLRKNSLKDYKAGIDWLIANEYTSAGQIGIRGGSYGGYVVLGMITEYPDLLSAAVCNVGIANFHTFLQNTAPYRRHLREAEYGPLSDSAFLREISPLHKSHLIKTPLLVVHGANDPRVPVGEARQILKAVADRGGVVDSLIFADEGHGSAKRENIIEEYRRAVAFFDTNLKGLQPRKETSLER